MALDATRWRNAIVAAVNTTTVAHDVAAAMQAAYVAAPADAKPAGEANWKTLLDVLVPALAQAMADASRTEITGHAEAVVTIQLTDASLQIAPPGGGTTLGPPAPVDIGGAGKSSIA